MELDFETMYFLDHEVRFDFEPIYVLDHEVRIDFVTKCIFIS